MPSLKSILCTLFRFTEIGKGMNINNVDNCYINKSTKKNYKYCL